MAYNNDTSRKTFLGIYDASYDKTRDISEEEYEWSYQIKHN